MFYSSNQITNHSTPSISGGKKSTSGRRLVIIAAFPRIRWRDILCTSWLTVSLSSDPVCLAIAVPRRLSWLMAWWCMPPSVSNWEEDNPLLSAGFCCVPHFAIIRAVESSAWACSGGGKVGTGEGTGQSDVQRSIFSVTPPSDEHVARGPAWLQYRVADVFPP